MRTAEPRLRKTPAVSRWCSTPIEATASQWAAWRRDAPPEVIDSAPPRLAAKIAAAEGQARR